MKSDIEIAHSAKLKNIKYILGKDYEDIIEPYGTDMGKISYTHINQNNIRHSNLILVTAVTPTKSGIGKTTVSIGLNDALRKIGENSIAVLREPSLGPCFGMKGGACGGGYSQVVPMEKINLHFTGDFHAITAANNMLAAALDNYLYQNNYISTNVKHILFKRCVDINDRSLREIYYKIKKSDDKLIQTGFNITPASEIMAIFCLATDIDDLRNRLDNIILAEYYDGTYLYAKDLDITGSLVALLSEAFKPNIVQSLYNNPVLIHGGPFANIAHGCNSIVATKLGMSLCDYVVTEAGFGSDLGAEKFWDIKCDLMDIRDELKCVVLVCTIPGLKQFTGKLEDGFKNLSAHYDTLWGLGLSVIVTCNCHDIDTLEEQKLLVQYCNENNMTLVFNTCFTEGINGAINLAKVVKHTCEEDGKYAKCRVYNKYYKLDKKIMLILNRVYKYDTDNITIKFANKNIETKFNKIYYSEDFYDYYVCIAKTQYSMNDDPKWIPITGDKKDFTITNIEVNNGAKMIIVSAGDIMRMPGLPKEPAACKIDFINDEIVGLS